MIKLCRKKSFFFISTLFVMFYTYFLYFRLSKSEGLLQYIGRLSNSRRSTKLILLWTPGWEPEVGDEIVNGWNTTISKDCPHQCDFTDNKLLLSQSHALVYHGVNWNGNEEFCRLPTRSERMYDQIRLFFRIESPITLINNFTALDNQFNWTGTYRADSDIQFPYGKFRKIMVSDGITNQNEDFPLPTEESIRNKSLVAWMHSNCETHSRRDILADRLQKFIPVTIFGKCSIRGQLNCTRSECYKIFAKYFKFWLSFENSLCPDYVTEKLIFPMIYGMVPILYAHESVSRLIPPGSYINIRDFKTMEALANHLKFLDHNPKEYLKYFDWRRQYRARMFATHEFWCEFCRKLNSNNYPRKYYPSVHDWFYKNYTQTDQCTPPDVEAMFQ